MIGSDSEVFDVVDLCMNHVDRRAESLGVMWDAGDCDPWGAVMCLFFDVAETLYVKCSRDGYLAIGVPAAWQYRPGIMVDDTDCECGASPYDDRAESAHTGDSEECWDRDTYGVWHLNVHQLKSLGDACHRASVVLDRHGWSY